jgi:hypothetical protein
MMIDSRVRWFGAFFLIAAAGQLIWGLTLLKPHLSGLSYLVYWLICLVFTGLSILAALLDMRAIRKRVQDEQRQILDKAFHSRNQSLNAGFQEPPQEKQPPPSTSAQR